MPATPTPRRSGPATFALNSAADDRADPREDLVGGVVVGQVKGARVGGHAVGRDLADLRVGGTDEGYGPDLRDLGAVGPGDLREAVAE